MIGTLGKKKKKKKEKKLKPHKKKEGGKKVTNRQKACFSLISQNPGKNNLSKKRKRKVGEQELAINDANPARHKS
jgi:hypothetical protein